MAAQAAERGGTVRDASEGAAAKTVTVTSDGRAAAAPPANGKAPNALEARAWIDRSVLHLSVYVC